MLTETWFYPEYTENPLKTPALTIANGVAYAGFPTFYEYVTSKKTKLTVQSRTYQPGIGNIENTVENFFNSSQHTQISKRTETNSKGETIETNYKYAVDYKPDNCLSISDGASTYSTSCSSCLTQYNQDRALTNHNNAYWKYWDYQKYLKCLSEARKTFFAARKNFFNPSISGSFANCLVNAKTNASTELKPLFELQDRFINAPIEIYSKKSSNLTGATFSKYVYATAPSGMVYINSIQKINLASPSPSFTNSAISGNNLVKDSRYLDEASIIINNGNISQATAKDGIVTSYIWGYNNSLPVVEAINVNYSTLLTAYNTVNGDLSSLRNQSSLSNAYLKTYVYKLGIGITKETDSRGRNTNYEYDAFQRLSIIKDHDNNVLKRICYNYSGQTDECSGVMYTNDPQTGNFTRNNCTSGYTGSTVTYTVPSGTYFSPVSVSEANTQAVADVNANGQAYANANGTCTQLITINGYNTKSSTYTVRFTNNATGTLYTFYLNANTYVSYTLGTVPSGTYTVQFSPAGSPVYATYNINGYTQYGQYGATFYNISITSTSSASMY